MKTINEINTMNKIVTINAISIIHVFKQRRKNIVDSINMVDIKRMINK